MYHSAISSNAKTGKMLVTTSSKTTCPDTCPLKSGGCYAASGPLSWHWAKVSNGTRGGDINGLTDSIRKVKNGDLWRLNQAGDLPGDGDTINAEHLLAIVDANNGKRGFTYTHYELSHHNAALIEEANSAGFTINLSANNLSDADIKADAGIAPVVVVLPSNSGNTVTPAGRRVVVCPEMQGKVKDCVTCGLCAVRDRSYIIGFPAHGVSEKKANLIASSN